MHPYKEKPKIHKPILRNEIIITQAEQEPLPIAPILLRMHRRQHQALPLLIQQPRILRPAIMQPKPRELRIDIKVQEGTIRRRGDAWVEIPGRGSYRPIHCIIRL